MSHLGGRRTECRDDRRVDGRCLLGRSVRRRRVRRAPGVPAPPASSLQPASAGGTGHQGRGHAGRRGGRRGGRQAGFDRARRDEYLGDAPVTGLGRAGDAETATGRIWWATALGRIAERNVTGAQLEREAGLPVSRRTDHTDTSSLENFLRPIVEQFGCDLEAADIAPATAAAGCCACSSTGTAGSTWTTSPTSPGPSPRHSMPTTSWPTAPTRWRSPALAVDPTVDPAPALAPQRQPAWSRSR